MAPWTLPASTSVSSSFSSRFSSIATCRSAVFLSFFRYAAYAASSSTTPVGLVGFCFSIILLIRSICSRRACIRSWSLPRVLLSLAYSFSSSCRLGVEAVGVERRPGHAGLVLPGQHVIQGQPVATVLADVLDLRQLGVVADQFEFDLGEFVLLGGDSGLHAGDVLGGDPAEFVLRVDPLAGRVLLAELLGLGGAIDELDPLLGGLVEDAAEFLPVGVDDRLQDRAWRPAGRGSCTTG